MKPIRTSLILHTGPIQPLPPPYEWQIHYGCIFHVSENRYNLMEYFDDGKGMYCGHSMTQKGFDVWIELQRAQEAVNFPVEI